MCQTRVKVQTENFNGFFLILKVFVLCVLIQTVTVSNDAAAKQLL